MFTKPSKSKVLYTSWDIFTFLINKYYDSASLYTLQKGNEI